jgi:mannosyltransferase
MKGRKGIPSGDSLASMTSARTDRVEWRGVLARLAPLTRSVNRPEVMAIAIITALAAAVRLRHLGEQSIWVDEAASATRATMPLHAMWLLIGTRETNMALYFLILRVWIDLFGQSEAALRLPSAFASIATVPVLYCAGRRMFGATAGIVAALLFALAPSSVFYAQEARGYSMEALGVAGSLLFFVKVLDRPSTANLAGWTLTTVFAIYCHSLAATIIPAELVVLPLGSLRTLPWRRLGIALGALTVLVGPYLALLVHNDHGQIDWLGPVTWVSAANVLYGIANEMRIDASGHLMVLATAFGMLLGVVGLVRAWDESREKAIPYALAASAILVPVTLIGLASFRNNLLFYRYLVFTTPALCLFISGGIAALRGWRIQTIALVVLVTVFAWHTSHTLQYVQREPWREIATFIKASGRPGDALVTYFAEDRYALDYNLAQLGVPDGYFAHAYPDWDENIEMDHRYYIDRDAQEMMAQHLIEGIDTSAAQNRSLFLLVRGRRYKGFVGSASVNGILQRLKTSYAAMEYRHIGDFYVLRYTNAYQPKSQNTARPRSS